YPARHIVSKHVRISPELRSNYDMSDTNTRGVLAPKQPRRNKLQAIQRKIRIDGFDEPGFLANQRRLAAGADDACVGTQFLFKANEDSVDQSDISIKETALHARYRRRPDNL